MSIYKKLFEIQKELQFLQKKDKNAFQKYTYVSSSNCLAAARQAMDKHGILLLMNVLDVQTRTNEKLNIFTEMRIEFTFVDIDAPKETVSAVFVAHGTDTNGEKAVGKAYTYAEKYFILKTFHIPTDEDDPDKGQASNQNNTKAKGQGINQDNTITKEQTNTLVSLLKDHIPEAKKILQKYGYQKTSDIQKKDYDKIKLEFEARAKELKGG